MDKNVNKDLEKDDTPDLVISLIILIILVLFIGWVMYLLISSGFERSSIENPVSSDNRSESNIFCEPGQCATNIQSGIKTCPINDIAVQINPAVDICNSRFLCDNPSTPFAVQSDGSTNINGICEQNTECQCLRESQCPNYILSAFTTSNGNPYEQFSGQRITFPQISSSVTSKGLTDIPPIKFSNPSLTFCAAPISWLPFANPGCSFIAATGPNSMNYDDILICTGMINGCSGVKGSPCLQGILAAITDNPDNLTRANLITTQFGCVRGESCPCGTLPVFDTNFGGIVCRDLPVI